MSSYARNLLSRGEEVVFESRQHWFSVLAQTWAWILGAFIAFALLLWVGTNTIGGEMVDNILTLVLLLGLILALARIGLVIWAWRNQEYLITTRRVIKAEGIFNKEMGDSSLEKVNDARLSQSWLGRIFDYGTLDILTASEAAETGLLNDFPMLAEPVKFKVAMLNQKERLERPDLAPPPMQRPAASAPLQRAEPMPPRAGSDRVSEVRADAPASAGPASEPAASAPAPAETTGTTDQLTSTLESLAGLRDRGLITPDEYEAKKRELLERM
jgi:PH (Pleckstrin Homology) domain-containing protein/putative oligomerization/nucleic acid binding protein